MSSSVSALPSLHTRFSGRYLHVDQARAFALLVMLLDHILMFTGALTPLRFTVTRVALPLFFCLAGMLLRRLSWRLVGIAVIGAGIVQVVPEIDNPNILLLFAVLAPLALLFRRLVSWRTSSPWMLLPIAAATVMANLVVPGTNAYNPTGLLALLCLGGLLTPDAFRWAARFPLWMARLGRYPVTFYVTHLLVLELFL